jgi:hypothetical protein
LYVPDQVVLCVCYHEAAYHDALPLSPLGRERHDYNTTKFPSDAPTTEGPDYVIMSSRGRPTAATSAVDLVVPRGRPFLSPVTGVVAKVKRYRLYGRYDDTKIWIRPAADTRYRVVMIHIDRVMVRTGDEVVQGVTAVGVARVFPFSSQTDIYVPGRNPHVHVEIVDPRRER